jgi:2-amino-4-hydroxy-6-hydroxymethyldihydropteridine diphosphokinase
MILIAFGSSLSFRGKAPADIITSALCALAEIVSIDRVSRLYRSPAWPDHHDPPFVNAVVRVSTTLRPAALLASLHAVEAAYGRRRGLENGPRTLDLDLIDYDGLVTGKTPESSLILPHPRAKTRDFVLLPLSDVAPDWTYPGTGEALRDLIRALPAISAEPLLPA